MGSRFGRFPGLLVLVLLLAACAPAGRQQPQPLQTPAPDARVGERTSAFAPLDFRALVENQEVRAGTWRYMESGEAVEVRLVFPVPMDPHATEAAVARLAPPGVRFQWPEDRELLVLVPPGGAFDIGAADAPSRDGRGRVLSGVRRIARPSLHGLSLYRVTDLVAGHVTPARTWRVRAWINGLVISADGRRALLYEAEPMAFGPAPHMVDLETGVVTPLPNPAPGQPYSLVDWLPDGRLLMVGGGRVWVGRPGQSLELIATAGGRTARVSPAGRYLAMWGHPTGVRIVDLDTRDTFSSRSLFRRCSPDGTNPIAWSPDEQVLAGVDCDREDGRNSRIRLVQPATGEQLRSLEGMWLIDWLPTGTLLAWRPPQERASAGEGTLLLLDAAGKELGEIPGTAAPSPDGKYLLQAVTLDGKSVTALIETATGNRYPIELPGRPKWTAGGDLLVVVDLRE